MAGRGYCFESNSFRYQRFNSPFPTTGYNEYSCNLSVYSVYNGAWFGRIDNWFTGYTTVRGLVGSIIGLPDFTGNARVAIRIMNPIKTSVQQMSMLGKGWLASDKTFNRPTSIELVVSPYYRIYWSGEYYDLLLEHLVSGHSHYHTYLGSAFALTFPKLINSFDCSEIKTDEEVIECVSVVPIEAVKKLIPRPACQYGRVSGMHCEYFGNRRFGLTKSILYEVSGRTLTIVPNNNRDSVSYIFAETSDGECICLF